MTRVNRKLEYALMALKHMSMKVPGQLTSAKEIVEATGVPFDATARVLQLMATRKLLRSEQGPHGGYVIVRDLSKVSFFELYEMILGKLETARCFGDGKNCGLQTSCNIQSPMGLLHRRMTDFYRGVALSDLLRLNKDKEAGHEAQAE